MGAKPKARGPKKQARKAKEKPQKARFIEAARKIGVDETGKEFERFLGKVLKTKAPKKGA